MNRLQKKCIVASTGFHLLLALILFIGPVFASSRNQTDNLPILDFVPVKTVDELVAPGGGSPKAKPVAATPVQPQPQPTVTAPPPMPQPEKVREADPPKETPSVRQEDDSLEASKERPPKKIEISTKLVTRKRESITSTDNKAREEAQARAEAKALADARRKLARQLGQAADNIGNELSGGTTVEMQGPGGGGVPYANWRQAIKSAYENAWLLPDGVVDDEATAVASVTIARDGTVLSSYIIHLSGDSVVDRSVQATLDRVQHTPPLPETAKEDKRTVTIKFNVRAKRSIG